MAVLTAHTSFGGIDAETGETREAGSTTVMTNLGADVISDRSLGDNYEVETFSVQRNGSSQFITDTNDLKDTDLVTIGADNEGFKVEWSTLKSMGMAPSVAAAIQEANAAQVWHSQGVGEVPKNDMDDQWDAQGTDEDPLECKVHLQQRPQQKLKAATCGFSYQASSNNIMYTFSIEDS